MTENKLNFQPIGDFQLEATSVDEACDAIIERLAIQFALHQPKETLGDTVAEMTSLSAGGEPDEKKTITLHFNSPLTRFTITNFLTYFSKVTDLCDRAYRANETGEPALAWRHIGNAMYCMGMIDALWFIEPSNAILTKANGMTGAKSRDEKFEQARILARKLALEGDYQDRAKAARAIKAEVVAEALKHGASLSATRAERTVYDWLQGLTFRGKR